MQRATPRSVVSWLVVFGFGVASVACSSEDGGTTTVASSAAPATTEPAPTEPATTSVLAPLLLTVDDLGPGWEVDPDVNPADFTSIGDLRCTDSALNPTIVERLVPTDVVILNGTDPAVFEGVQELMLSGDPARLAADLDILFEAATACLGSERVNEDGERVRYDPFEIPDLGDQRLAGELTVGEPPDYQTTWRGHTAIVRVGAIALMVNQFEILSTPEAIPSMTGDDFIALLELAVDRVVASGIADDPGVV